MSDELLQRRYTSTNEDTNSTLFAFFWLLAISINFEEGQNTAAEKNFVRGCLRAKSVGMSLLVRTSSDRAQPLLTKRTWIAVISYLPTYVPLCLPTNVSSTGSYRDDDGRTGLAGEVGPWSSMSMHEYQQYWLEVYSTPSVGSQLWHDVDCTGAVIVQYHQMSTQATVHILLYSLRDVPRSFLVVVISDNI